MRKSVGSGASADKRSGCMEDYEDWSKSEEEPWLEVQQPGWALRQSGLSNSFSQRR